MAGSVSANILDRSVQWPHPRTTGEPEKLCFARLHIALLQLPQSPSSTPRGGFFQVLEAANPPALNQRDQE